MRRPTLSLLGAMLPDAAPQDAFDRLRRLPFVELSSDGLVLHDTVREVVAAYLRASDPDRSRRYRIAAWRQLRDEVTRATSHEMWRYTADLLYILENPIVREAFFPTPEHLYFVDPAQDADWPAIREIAAASEPPDPSRSSRTGGGACPMRSGSRGTAPGRRRILTSWRSWSDLATGCSSTRSAARIFRDHLRRPPVPRGQRVPAQPVLAGA